MNVWTLPVSHSKSIESVCTLSAWLLFLSLASVGVYSRWQALYWTGVLKILFLELANLLFRFQNKTDGEKWSFYIQRSKSWLHRNFTKVTKQHINRWNNFLLTKMPNMSVWHCACVRLCACAKQEPSYLTCISSSRQFTWAIIQLCPTLYRARLTYTLQCTDLKYLSITNTVLVIQRRIWKV